MKKVFLFAFLFVTATIFVSSLLYAADESNMKAMAATWEKEYNADNLAGVAALYAADGCRMPPNAETAKGTSGITAQLKGDKDHGAAKVKVAVTMSETSGDSGHATGTYVITGADGSHVDHGKWMNIVKKMNGTWKIQCDIWNSDMAMPQNKM